MAAREGYERTGRLVVRVARDVRTMVDRRLEPLGLTMQQAELLVWVYLHDDVSPHDVIDLLTTDAASVSRLVDRLEAKRLLARRAHRLDRRALTLELTPAGRALARRLRRVAAQGNERLLRGLTPAERETLRTLLLRVAANARSMSETRT